MVLCWPAFVEAISERLSWDFAGRTSRLVLSSILVMAISDSEPPKHYLTMARFLTVMREAGVSVFFGLPSNP